MVPTPDPFACAEFTDDLGVLAVGALTGRARAHALAHVEECPACAVELESFSAGADALMSLYPQCEPDRGFTERAMATIEADRLTRRGHLTRRAKVVLVAVASVALAGGVTAVALGRGQSGHATLATAALTSPSGARGTVSVVSAGGNWLVMTIDDAPANETVSCRVTLADGSSRTVGRFVLRDGYGSWMVRLPVASSAVQAVKVVDDRGGVLASATL